MPVQVSFNNIAYKIPQKRESITWGGSLSNYLIAISTGVVQKAGGTFTLTAQLDFGSAFGLVQPIIGTTTNDSGAAGTVGETITASCSADLTIGTYKTIATVSLTAGEWDVNGLIVYLAAFGGDLFNLNWVGGISLTDAAQDSKVLGGYNESYNQQTSPPFRNYLAIGKRRIQLASTTSVFLTSLATGSSGNAKTDSFIKARRVR